jgi:hypothetical protein
MSPAGKGGATTVLILLKRRNSAINSLSAMNPHLANENAPLSAAAPPTVGSLSFVEQGKHPSYNIEEL